jgi:hypothetical protein
LRWTKPDESIRPIGMTIGIPVGVTMIMAMFVELWVPEAV